jgi:hypothetical protein
MPTLASEVGKCQGRLNASGSSATGSFDLTFSVWDAASGPSQIGSTQTKSAVSVSDGLFSVMLDFGAGVFTGPPRWLEIAVRPAGSGAFTTLTQRQPVTPAPYAVFAANGGGGDSGPWLLNGANTYYNAGNVGIGTNTPANRLTVRTPTLGYGIEHTDGDTRLSTFVGRGSGWLGTLSNHKLTLFANDNGFQNMTATLDTAGHFGIGTDSPIMKLHVEGDEFLSGDAYFGERGRQMLNLFGTGFGIGIQTATLYSRSGAGFAWHVGGTHSDNFYDSGGGTTLMTLDGTRGLDFGSRLGQHLSLWGSDGPRRFGIGIQAQTLYSRTGGNAGDGFAWHKGGVHNDGVRNPGGGQTLMTLDEENGLAISGNATQAREKGGWVKAMAYVNGDGNVIRSYNPFGTTTCDKTASGRYTVHFGFRVDDRFISLTAQASRFAAGPEAGASYLFTTNPNDLFVDTFDVPDSNPRDVPFMVIVY